MRMQIEAVIDAALQIPDLDKAVDRLVTESLHEGGIDNITVIVGDVVESDGTDEVMVLGAASDQPIRAPGVPRRQLAEEDDRDVHRVAVQILEDEELGLAVVSVRRALSDGAGRRVPGEGAGLRVPKQQDGHGAG